MIYIIGGGEDNILMLSSAGYYILFQKIGKEERNAV